MSYSDSGRFIRIEFEIPPLRAIYVSCFEDDGQTLSEVEEGFRAIKPLGKIRKIERIIEPVAECHGDRA